MNSSCNNVCEYYNAIYRVYYTHYSVTSLIVTIPSQIEVFDLKTFVPIELENNP